MALKDDLYTKSLAAAAARKSFAADPHDPARLTALIDADNAYRAAAENALTPQVRGSITAVSNALATQLGGGADTADIEERVTEVIHNIVLDIVNYRVFNGPDFDGSPI